MAVLEYVAFAKVLFALLTNVKIRNVDLELPSLRCVDLAQPYKTRLAALFGEVYGADMSVARLRRLKDLSEALANDLVNSPVGSLTL